MSISVVLFTCDLRLHDHPPLTAALDGTEQVVPLFVRDRAVDAAGFAAPNRLAFLADCLRDLDAGLRERGGRLVVRHGSLVDELCKVAAEADADEVHMASDVSAHAHRREEAAPGPGGGGRTAARPRHGDHGRRSRRGGPGRLGPFRRLHSLLPALVPGAAAGPARGPEDRAGPGRRRIRAPAVP